MPRLSPQMTRGAVEAWRVGEGEGFAEFAVLLDVSTAELVPPEYAEGAFAGRVRMLVEAQFAGTVARLLAPASSGADLPVGTPLAVVVGADELEEAAGGEAGRASMLEAARAWAEAVRGDASAAAGGAPLLEWQSYLAEGDNGGGGCG
jgi:pyruvate/2-oxoglutarate dehydrogenase complex dihydrolipoamide acyltransferase (E2) component